MATQATNTSGGPPANASQIEYWNARTGETWAKLQEQLDRQIGGLGLRAITALAPAGGERIIDIGCGCGQTSLELARRVGDHGTVLGIDISAPMLAVARARGAGLENVRFIEADAQTFAFEPGAADAAFSRFGVMFFADPTAAFANIRAALSPGGRLAFVCWRDQVLNPFMTLPFAAAAHLLPPMPPPADPHAPGPFAFADFERVRAILERAGFSDIAALAHDEAIGGGDLEETTRTALSIGPLGAVLREHPHLAGTVREAVRAALAPYAGPQGVLIASASWIVTARNPHQAESPAR